jgi:hypothetical protein
MSHYNLQVCQVYKRYIEPTIFSLLPCLAIVNDIFRNQINTHHENNNLLFAKIPM